MERDFDTANVQGIALKVSVPLRGLSSWKADTLDTDEKEAEAIILFQSPCGD